MPLMAFEMWSGGVDRNLLDSFHYRGERKIIGQFLLKGWTEKFWTMFNLGVDGNLMHRYEQTNAFNDL